MLYIKVNAKNKARIIYPRRWQMILDLGTGKMERIPDKPFPKDEDLKDPYIKRTIAGLFNMEIENEKNTLG